MKKLPFFNLFIIFIISFLTSYTKDLKFEIVVPTYNNEKYCIDNLKSLDQNYPDHLYHITIIDDKSTDKTGSMIDHFIAEHKLHDKITVIHNTIRVGALENLYKTIHSLPDTTIVVTVDGDDQLAHEDVLTRLHKEYSEQNAWITYGQFIWHSGGRSGFCRNYPDVIVEQNKFRSYIWYGSHLRTFYASLFKKIKKEDLICDGKFFPMAWDLAIMFPMMEMAGKEHIKFIPDILYIYNDHNPLNDHKVNSGLVVKLDKIIRDKKQYELVEDIFN